MLSGKAERIFKLLSSSYVIWAIIAMIGANLLFQKLPFDRYAQANRSMVWWAVNDFRNQKTCPDVVLVGSSLLMHVLNGGDAEYLKLPQNEVYHHKPVILEDLLQKRTGVRVNSFAFAIAGTMASDAYALAKTLFVQERKPRVIIYGIAPRDLIDNTLGNPSSTDTFRLMSRLGGIGDVDWTARNTFWGKVEFLFESVSSLYRHRSYFVYLQQNYVKPLLRIAGYQVTDEVHTPFALRRLALLEMPEDIGVNERIATPGAPVRYTDNSDEYRRRYQPFKQKDFMAQRAYLEKFLSYCQQQGIEVVLVNMPLTQENLNLMPAGTYDLYKQTLTTLAQQYGSQLIDMQDTRRFDKSLYCDTAHMTGAGGVKFFQTLAERLTDGTHLAIGRNGSWQ
jgi:hypothetical protein